jgi:hypothetical protein
MYTSKPVGPDLLAVWDRAGNPVRSMPVQEWYGGYRRWLVEQGYRPQSAVPWAEEDLVAVLAAVDKRISITDGIEREKLLRDAFTLCVLWETCSRGATAVCWRVQDLWLPSGMPFASRVARIQARAGQVAQLSSCVHLYLGAVTNRVMVSRGACPASPTSWAEIGHGRLRGFPRAGIEAQPAPRCDARAAQGWGAVCSGKAACSSGTCRPLGAANHWVPVPPPQS